MKTLLPLPTIGTTRIRTTFWVFPRTYELWNYGNPIMVKFFCERVTLREEYHRGKYGSQWVLIEINGFRLN